MSRPDSGGYKSLGRIGTLQSLRSFVDRLEDLRVLIAGFDTVVRALDRQDALRMSSIDVDQPNDIQTRAQLPVMSSCFPPCL